MLKLVSLAATTGLLGTGLAASALAGATTNGNRTHVLAAINDGHVSSTARENQV